jgi:hypothetical protein
MRHYKIKAKWDADAGVYVASCDEIGLVTEAPTFEALSARLDSMVLEMADLNDPQDRDDIMINIVTKRSIKAAAHPH